VVVLKCLAGAGCLLIGMRPESIVSTVFVAETYLSVTRSGAAEAVKAPKARAHVEMTSATVWRERSARAQIQFLVLPFELFMV
jgi:hypothetical protein